MGIAYWVEEGVQPNGNCPAKCLAIAASHKMVERAINLVQDTQQQQQ